MTSAAWGETLGAAVGLAHVSDPAGPPVTRDFLGTGSYTVNIAGHVVPATVSLRAPYDPSGARAR